MTTIKISGHTKIRNLKDRFRKVFQVDLQVFDKEGNPADDESTLTEIRTKKPKSAKLSIRVDALVENFEKWFAANYGVKITILNADGSRVNANTTLKEVQKQYEGSGKHEQSASHSNPFKIEAKATMNDLLDRITSSDIDHDTDALKEQEKEAESSMDFRYLAEDIVETGDKEWAKRVYEKAVQKAEDESDYRNAAESIANSDYLGDKDWAREVYQQALAKADSFSSLKDLADSVASATYLGDNDWARELYKNALDLAKYSGDYSGLAMSIARDDGLGDKDWARVVLEKAINEAEDIDEWVDIAWCAADDDYIGDKSLGKAMYEKAEEMAPGSPELKKVAEGIEKNLQNNEWAVTLLRKAKDKIGGEEFVMLGNFLSLAETLANLGDKESAAECYSMAESHVDDDDDRQQLADEILASIDDVEFAHQIRSSMDSNTDTRIIEYTERGNYEKVEQLLDEGVDIEAQNEDEQTALIIAAKTDQLRIAELLISHGANIEARDEDGATALMWAACNSLQLVQMLIEKGADLNAKDNDGDDAIFYAEDESKTDIAEYLKSK